MRSLLPARLIPIPALVAAVLTAAVAVPGAHASARRLPVVYNILSARPGATASPPGANDFSCRPGRRAPEPGRAGPWPRRHGRGELGDHGAAAEEPWLLRVRAHLRPGREREVRRRRHPDGGQQRRARRVRRPGPRRDRRAQGRHRRALRGHRDAAVLPEVPRRSGEGRQVRRDHPAVQRHDPGGHRVADLGARGLGAATRRPDLRRRRPFLRLVPGVPARARGSCDTCTQTGSTPSTASPTRRS